MSFLIATPDFIATAATDLANIGSTIGSANFAAAAATTGVLPAAADEVSAQIAALFSEHAAGYQQLSAQAAMFHERFVSALTSGASTYAAAEANVVQTLASAAPAFGLDFGAGLAGLEASLSADIAGLSASFNAALSGGFGGGLSGLAPLGAALAADLNGGLSALAQTGVAFSNSLGAGLSGLAGGLSAGLPGLQASLGADLAGLSASLNAALSGGFGIALPTNLNAALAAFGSIFGISPSLGASISAGLSGLSAQLNAALTGGLTVGLSGLPTLLVNAVAPFQALLTAGSPATFFAQLQAMETGFNTTLLNAELGFNAALTGQEAALETALFGGTGAVGGVIDSTYNFWNMVLGTGEAAFDSLLGVPFPATFTGANLLVGPLSGVIGGGAIGGLLGAVDTKFLFDLNVIGAVASALTGNGSLQAALSAAITAAGLQASLSGVLNGSLFAGLPTTGAALVAAPIAGLQGLAAGQINFLGNLVTAETGFNTNLLSNELGWEASIFGPNALNGALNRAFNVGNLVLLTGEQTVNSLLGGAQVPALDAGAFLTGGGGGAFNTNGGIGGLEGIFDQSLALGADLGGLLLSA